MQQHLTTTQLADAVGVSESSVKRWIDSGRIAATRTAGGHRRVSVAEAARYLRDAGIPVEAPERLGLPDLAAYARRNATDAEAGEALYDHLVQGRADAASGLLQARFLAGANVAELVDGPLRQAMTEVGTLWRSGPDGILAEHRATETAVQAMNRLRALLQPPLDGPVALGCGPSDDPYVLPSLSAAAVAEDEGYRAVNLGPETPLDTLALGVAALRPRLVWISVSVTRGAGRLRREILDLAERLREQGAGLAVGGAQVDRLALSRDKTVFVGKSMAELRAVARSLLLPGHAVPGAEEVRR